MRERSGNPANNALLAGTQEEALLSAIKLSGYPLQGVVASKLLREFNVTEEWGYLDDQTNDHRSLDIYAFKRLKSDDNARISPGLILLIECKRSRHPFVFFKRVVERPAPSFPTIDGLPNRQVWLHNLGGQRMLQISPARALGLDKLPFVTSGPPVCAAFSKAAVKGNRVELSGSDGFNTIVLPLVKALRHTVSSHRRPETKDVLFPMLLLCVSVIDAPMLLIEEPESAGDPVLAPWMRIVRHESYKEVGGTQSRFYALDAVHVGFFDDYVEKHVLPFASEFATRAIERQDVLRFGGDVHNLNEWDWDKITPRRAL